jgi:uncharacterized repeat protein (TIGR03803 family)
MVSYTAPRNGTELRTQLLFKVTTTGALTTLYTFSGKHQETIYAGLALGADGNFYGQTSNGGENQDGRIFKVTPAGAFTTLFFFDGTDGGNPYTPLTLGPDDNFYSTTNWAQGTIFQVTSAGKLTTLADFNDSDGNSPFGGLTLGIDGNYYGTTDIGGVQEFGVVFKVTPGGVITPLLDFNGFDGQYPYGQLVQYTNGNFYGTTSQGGTAGGQGTIFEISPTGVESVLHSFDGADGYFLVAGLVLATDGNFYGTTQQGGTTDNLGTIFKITPGGTFTTLYNFTGPDGGQPTGGLIQHTNGLLYGTTTGGGTSGAGTVYSLDLGLGPFVATVPSAGKVGATITILGTNLTDVTSVTFHGIPASFTVGSSTYLTATVPSGATSGPVKVVTSSRTLRSNTAFHIMP